MRRIAWLGVLALSCTSTSEGVHDEASGDVATPIATQTASPSSTTPSNTEAETPSEPAPSEPAPTNKAAESIASYYAVFLGDSPRVLVRTWGWGATTGAEHVECEIRPPSAGEVAACRTSSKPKGAAELVRSLGLGLDQAKVVEPEQIADWGPGPPSELWLIGSDAACKAEVGRPIVSLYSIDAEDPRLDLDDDFTVLELQWELSGCALDVGAWAPIGLPALAGDDSPAALRWKTAEIAARERFDPAKWKGRDLASALPQLQARASEWTDDEGASPADGKLDWWTQAATIPGTTLAERYFAVLWRHEPLEPDSREGYPCGTDEYGVIVRTRAGTVLNRPGDDACKGDACEDDEDDYERNLGELRGALVREGQVEHLLWFDSLDYAIARLEGDRLGEAYTVQTGAHHPESGGTDAYAVVRYCGP